MPKICAKSGHAIKMLCHSIICVAIVPFTLAAKKCVSAEMRNIGLPQSAV